jgi:hypothetical protein
VVTVWGVWNTGPEHTLTPTEANQCVSFRGCHRAIHQALFFFQFAKVPGAMTRFLRYSGSLPRSVRHRSSSTSLVNLYGHLITHDSPPTLVLICRFCLRPARVRKRERPRAFHSYDLHPSVCCWHREHCSSTRSDLRPAAVCPSTRLPAPVRQESTCLRWRRDGQEGHRIDEDCCRRRPVRRL